MIKLFFTACMFCSLLACAVEPEVLACRKFMGAAFENEKSANSFYNHTRNISESSPALMLGFKAVSEFMMCNHVSGPFKKLSHFNKGKDLLEQAIKKESGNVELRFMRFCTQSNAPAILQYNAKLKEDMKILLQYLTDKNRNETKDVSLFANIRKILLESKYCTEAEKLMIRNL